MSIRLNLLVEIRTYYTCSYLISIYFAKYSSYRKMLQIVHLNKIYILYH